MRELKGYSISPGIARGTVCIYSLAASRDNLISKERYHILHPSVVKML